MKFRITILFVLFFAFALSAQEKVDLQTIQKIRDEGLKNSRVMDYLGWLSDVLSPRLTSSPGYKNSTKWVAEKLKELGLDNVAIEPCGTVGRGWATEKAYAAMTSPSYSNLTISPKAWTGSTNGLIKGNAVLINIQSEDDIQKYKGKLKDAVVLNGAATVLKEHFTPDANRYTDKELEEMKTPQAQREMQPPQMPPQQQNQKPGQPGQPIPPGGARFLLAPKIAAMLKDEGAQLILEPSRNDYGTVATSSSNSRKAGSPEGTASAVVAAEQYNRMVRILEKNIPVTVEAEIKNNFYDADSLGYNVIAEIPGTDKDLKDEIVMLGGHLDAWHGATGAADNAAGVAVCMEALRILKKLNIQPRRTIRIGCWDAEEIGLVGSRNYVNAHFYDRTANKPKPDYDNFYVYFNYDNGAGKIRGIYTQGNKEAVPIFEEWLKPFNDLGATTVTIRNTGGTDHQSFDGVGLPAFQFIQDELAYETRIHHTTMDTFDHAPKDDLIQSATIMAAFIYDAAMRDGKFPRKAFDPSKMPQRRMPGN
jgi:carboxypeptidase Q